MKTSFKMVAMLLGIGVFPVCAQAQKKVVIEDEEPIRSCLSHGIKRAMKSSVS